MKCPKCGSINFFIEESLLWKGTTNEDNSVEMFNKEGDIVSVNCHDCEAEIPKETWEDVEFIWN